MTGEDAPRLHEAFLLSSAALHVHSHMHTEPAVSVVAAGKVVVGADCRVVAFVPQVTYLLTYLLTYFRCLTNKFSYRRGTYYFFFATCVGRVVGRLFFQAELLWRPAHARCPS